MANCSSHIEIHKEAGSTQANRLLHALKTSSIKIDERKTEDLILFTNKLSKYLNYYNNSNVSQGNWTPFFQWESTSILAQIAKIDIAQFVTDLTIIKRELIFINDPSDQEQLVIPFFNVFSLFVEDLQKKIKHLPNELQIKAYFLSTNPAIKNLLEAIDSEISTSTDLVFTLQHHLFNKKIQNLFGLLTDWKKNSLLAFQKNLESYANHNPQYALYLSFLKLFGIARDDLNQFTKRHLDFYYQNVLHLYPEQAKPDYVHLSIEPQKNSASFLLKEGSVFLAGKNGEGQNKFYSALSNTVINRIKLDSIYSGYKKNNKYYFEDLIDKNAKGESWKTFTGNTITTNFGLAMASPLFYLKGGQRVIKISFENAIGPVTINANDYDFFLSGEDEWMMVSASNSENSVTLNVPVSEKAIVPFDPEIHQETILNTPFPILKITAKNGALHNHTFSKISVEVIVTGLNEFNLYSDTGSIDSTAPFQPFGAVPKKGSGFVFTCKEFFQKKGAIATFSIKTDNTSWKILEKTDLTFLQDGKWIAGNHWESDQKFGLQDKSVIPFEFSEDVPLSKSDTNGFARIILSDVDYSGEKYLEDFIKASKNASPDLPYVPTIKSISLDYRVTQTLSDNNDFEIFQLYPQGFEQVNNKTQFSILPSILNEGEIIIGLKDAGQGNIANLLFQLLEGSANPRQEPVSVKWKYLKHNQWVEFAAGNATDNTHDLTESGIVQLKVPLDSDLQHQTILPAGIWWIKIEVPERVDAICDFVGIHTQALKAVLFDFEKMGNGFLENTPEKTISKLFRPQNGIKKIEQPYPSFDGKAKDSDAVFYQRTSERLRHKDRAITSWDYEKLVLDNFPGVFRVKCLNHYRYDSMELSDVSAGYVTLIPIAKSTLSKLPDYWKPIVDIGTMKNIKSFLKRKTSPHVRMQVKAPHLEKLELVFDVKYRETPGADIILYGRLLDEAINQYLSPWIYNVDTPISFQTELEKSKLIQLVEKQPYVDYISNFKVNHLVLAETTDDIVETMADVESIIPKTDFTLFIPHTHQISPINKTCCE